MLKNDSDWEIKEEFIGKTIPETGGITVSAEYVGADKENYENKQIQTKNSKKILDNIYKNKT